jgi:hypothetical protein
MPASSEDSAVWIKKDDVLGSFRANSYATVGTRRDGKKVVFDHYDVRPSERQINRARKDAMFPLGIELFYCDSHGQADSVQWFSSLPPGGIRKRLHRAVDDVFDFWPFWLITAAIVAAVVDLALRGTSH